MICSYGPPARVGQRAQRRSALRHQVSVAGQGYSASAVLGAGQWEELKVRLELRRRQGRSSCGKSRTAEYPKGIYLSSPPTGLASLTIRPAAVAGTTPQSRHRTSINEPTGQSKRS
jgi:hypothetical protein